MSTTLIINPAAGRGRAGEVREAVVAAASALWGDVHHVDTNRPGHAVELARQAAELGGERILVVGGDGTLHEVANGVLTARSARLPALGVIAVGTGNDFAKLSGTQALGPVEAVGRLAHARVAHFDVGRAWDEYFINSLGIGFDAEVARCINQPSRLRGPMAYVAGVVAAWRAFQPVQLAVHSDGFAWSGRLLLIEVAIGCCVGGAFRLTPNAKADDGLFDVCVIEPVDFFGLLRKIPHVFRGTHAGLKEVRIFQTAELSVTSAEQPLLAQFDGEIRSRGHRADIVLERGRLPVLVLA